MTDEQIEALIEDHGPDGDFSGTYRFARAVEALVVQECARVAREAGAYAEESWQDGCRAAADAILATLGRPAAETRD